MIYTNDKRGIYGETRKYRETYLGAGISKAFYPDGSYAWLIRLNDYVREALRNITKDLTWNDLRFNKKLYDPNYLARTPFCPIDY